MVGRCHRRFWSYTTFAALGLAIRAVAATSTTCRARRSQGV